MAVALIDLGGFDDMKDAIGDAGEDEVLIEIANRLRSDVPEGALIARLRGDKFGLVMPASERRGGARGRAGDARRGFARHLGRSGGPGQRQCGARDGAARRRRRARN